MSAESESPSEDSDNTSVSVLSSAVGPNGNKTGTAISRSVTDGIDRRNDESTGPTYSIRHINVDFLP